MKVVNDLIDHLSMRRRLIANNVVSNFLESNQPIPYTSVMAGQHPEDMLIADDFLRLLVENKVVEATKHKTSRNVPYTLYWWVLDDRDDDRTVRLRL